MWFLADLGSRNGTLLNGNPVAAPASLKAGDRIEMGGVTLTCGGYSPGRFRRRFVLSELLHDPRVRLDESG